MSTGVHPYRTTGWGTGERRRGRGCRRADTGAVGAAVSPVPLPTRVFLACGVTDMRKGFDGLAVLVQQVLREDPHSGALFAFRGKRGHLVKLLWFDGQGLCLFSKRLDRGRFIWPVTATGTVVLTPAQLSMLLEGIDWRRPERTFTPMLAG
jgi:transposase